MKRLTLFTLLVLLPAIAGAATNLSGITGRSARVATDVVRTAPSIGERTARPVVADTGARPSVTPSSGGVASGKNLGATASRTAVNTSVGTRGTTATATTTSRTTARNGATSAAPAQVAGRARSATVSTAPSVARSAVSGTASRGNSARATALFTDVSKLGGVYANCRDTYNTCMDQFCGGANDTYRRCICSERFRDYARTETALGTAKSLILQFQDNNLEAVDKSASEVKAMYSATLGEAAIRKDTSASSKLLAQIDTLLAGGVVNAAPTSNKVGSGLDLNLNLDFTADLGDIWGGSGIFGSGTDGDTWTTSSKNLAEMSGTALYTEVNNQCSTASHDACENNNTLSMVRSAYGILISQDCSAYEKSLEKQKEAVASTVRDAYKILRQARLEEYREHNSADINECITKVRASILSDNACGTNYQRCLDFTGKYINAITGEPLYTPELYKMAELITLPDNGDLLAVSGNQGFSRLLDTKRMFAETPLSSCRDKAEIVWNEFKRQAIIEISQLQNEKIEEVKSTCVSTMAQCYDTISGQLIDFDTTSSQSAGAMGARAAAALCQDKVATCAALHSTDNTKCVFKNRMVTNADTCGLKELLNFVSTVNMVKVNEECTRVLTDYIEELCAPAASDTVHTYPYGCRLLSKGAPEDITGQATNTLYGLLGNRARMYCGDPKSAGGRLLTGGTSRVATIQPGMHRAGDSKQIVGDGGTVGGTGYVGGGGTVGGVPDMASNAGNNATVAPYKIDNEIEQLIKRIVGDVTSELSYVMGNDCESQGFLWLNPEAYDPNKHSIATSFSANVMGGKNITDWGVCGTYKGCSTEPGVRCDADGNVTYTEEWYRYRCADMLSGSWNSSAQTCTYRP